MPVFKPCFIPALAALAVASPALADCSRSGFKYGPGFERFTTFWSVEKDSACIGALQPNDTAIVSIGVERGAPKGQAGVAGKSSFAYNPAPGFVGRETFVLRVDWIGPRGEHGRTLIDVISTVK